MLEFNKYRVLVDSNTNLIFDLVEKIDNSIIDSERSKIFRSDSLLIIHIFSNNDRSYPFKLLIDISRKKNSCSIGFGEDKDLISEIYDEDISKKEIFNYTFNLFTNYLQSYILVEKTIENKIVIKLEIKADKIKRENGDTLKLVRRNKPHYFWRKSLIQSRDYFPWLN